MPFITVADNYAILNSDRTFKEWRYLVEGTEYNENLVLAKLTIAPPDYNSATEKLVENISVGDREVTQSWEVQQLSDQEIVVKKRPNPVGFMREGFSRENEDMFRIYSAILQESCSNLAVSTWFTQLLSAAQPAFFKLDGWNSVISQLAAAMDLSASDRAIVNSYLAKYDLDEVL
ncbi:MAG: hypothetical protein EBR90_02135 [Actinobacteria bacterium]|nr:hypothetical protein [Actinomycetota bacterium]